MVAGTPPSSSVRSRVSVTTRVGIERRASIDHLRLRSDSPKGTTGLRRGDVPAPTLTAVRNSRRLLAMSIGDTIASPPTSAWTVAAEAAPETRPLEGDRRADVVVVGAGYTGLSAALHLAQRGADVVVLDAAELGGGASGRNGGQVIPGRQARSGRAGAPVRRGDRPRGSWRYRGWRRRLRLRAHRTAQDHLRCRRCGWIAPAPPRPRSRARSRASQQWQRRGAPVELLDARRIAQLTGSTRTAAAC